MSQNPTPQPQNSHNDRQEVLQRSQGEDHTVTKRHRLSLRHYPKDCPPLKVRWFYAVDSPKWKPSLPDHKRDESKPPTLPKKFVPFSFKDSQAIESAFQTLSDLEAEREESKHIEPSGEAQDKPRKVPVNEDYLFDVDVERRELSPAYWIGPIYEVRRGTWFFQDGSTIKPCEENLATQLEEGYLKTKPWASGDSLDPPSNLMTEKKEPKPLRNIADGPNTGQSTVKSSSGTRSYRLFGAYMNSTATYQDSSVLLTTDDFMSRVSTTVYQKLGGVPGTKIVRGFSEMKKQKEGYDARDSEPKGEKKFQPEAIKKESSYVADGQMSGELKRGISPPHCPADDTFQTPPKSALERQMSSLAGQLQNTADLEEAARRQEEKEMEDLKETDGEDREREIDHVVLVTHGIGQRLGLRLESINFIHDVNVLRKTMKSVYKASPDLQALNSDFAGENNNCRVQVLPVCWRHLLDFPYQGMRQNRKELDLADGDDIEDDSYPSLADITLENVPAVRNLISDLAMDVLLYQSAYCEHISNIVQQECNRIIKLFKERNPSFKGSVSLCGHSLGSAILFDILCHERTSPESSERKKSAEQGDIESDQRLNFECEELFCLGSPIALFQMLKGKTISGRSVLQNGILESPFPSKEQPGITDPVPPISDNNSIVSSPKCRQLYNIFHPSDPVSYRLEPLISPAMSSLRPQPLPSVKKSLWATSGQSLSIIGSRVGQSVGSLWANITTGVASSLLNRSLGLNSEDASTQSFLNTTPTSQQPQPSTRSDSSSPNTPDHRHETLIDSGLETLYGGFEKARGDRRKATSGLSDGDDKTSHQENEARMRKLRIEDSKVRSLNANGRVDYSIQE
ncbi:hypothetical protein FE257_005516 [Aspergillus nanangensis]|uniref:DDHD domain-containing protein n=1 Tax=Aspergillus nanangensis TaxID=2582783 RepID=A0AAD4CA78_ASPNN|nr:hypothetical protein FE257_005516 [Aspergillus nanangensis]